MYDVKGIKFTAKAIFATWAKTGYLFDLGENGGWFICEYFMRFVPTLFINKLSKEEVKKVLDKEKKIIFGGYQPFELENDTSNVSDKLIFKEYLNELYTKGLLSNNEEIDVFYRENILIHSDLNENVVEDKKSNNDFIINYLGVQNFRNIGTYQSFDLSPITFFTGKNNIGKSSILKSLLLWSTLDYYFSFKKSTFFLNSNIDRSDNAIVKRLNLDVNTLFNNEFNSSLFSISLNIDHTLKKYPERNLKINFDFLKNQENNILELVCFKIDFIKNKEEEEFILKLESKDGNNVFYLNHSLLNINLELGGKPFDYIFKKEFTGVFNSLFNVNSEASLIDLFSADSVPKIIYDNIEFKSLLVNVSRVIQNYLEHRPIEYIPSQRSENSRFYNSNSSYFGELIEWLHENQINTTVVNEINYWLGQFHLEKFTTEKIGLYKFILKLGDKHIADLGFGVMQLFSVIAGSIIAKYRSKKIVIIEEPESNLHPDLQSKLTEFFFEINKNHNTQFLIETHSEYLIRKSQLIFVNHKLFENNIKNPFSVFYYDNVMGPYEMKYLSNGKFDKKFGSGFFDESDNLAMEIHRLNLRQNRK